MEDALAIQAGTISKRDIQLIKEFDSKMPKIEGDQTRLIQVVINALKNSVESFDEMAKGGERTITVSLKNMQEDKLILLEIADTASGFTAETGAKLFERGQTTKESGTGFGLYNCKQIVESHHGEIYIESAGTNKGACLSIKLPY
jgi:signal transduction histidine kinase